MGTNRIVKIFDTTLRDGEQAPGASMTSEEKLQVAEQLVRLHVDIIEAGFPASSLEDFLAVKKIASQIRGVSIAGLARASEKDIEIAWNALKGAEMPIIHVFLATSDIHLERKLCISRVEALQQIQTAVSYAKKLCPTVAFAAEDATRSDIVYLCEVLEVAIKAGATTLNVPDTVGYTSPDEFSALIRYIREHVVGIEDVALSVHCHDDLGLATANTLAAIKSGAQQVDVTINGLGERAGNTSLEEVVMALRTRPDLFGYADTRINSQELLATSQLVSRITAIPVPPNKAIIGANAFAHEAGIHQDGILKHRLTYEIMKPQAVGWTDTKLVLGKHSGRHGLDARLRQLGYSIDVTHFKIVYDEFMKITQTKKEITDDDLIIMMNNISYLT